MNFPVIQKDKQVSIYCKCLMNVFEKCNMCLQRIHVGYSLNNFSLLSVKIIKQRTRFL